MLNFNWEDGVWFHGSQDVENALNERKDEIRGKGGQKEGRKEQKK